MLKNRIIRFIYNLYPFTRGKRFLKGLYGFISGYDIIEDKNGNKMLLNLDNYIDSIVYFNGSYEEVHMKLLYKKYIENNCNYFIDIGANIGIYSIYFLKDSNLEKCFIFEPDPSNFAQLNANIYLNRVSNRAKLFNCALSNESRKGELYLSNEKKEIDLGKVNAGTHSLEKNENRHKDKVKIDIFRGDDLVDLVNETICLKIDVEGHELNVLKGLLNLLKNNKCLMIIEVFSENFSEVNEFLMENSFKQINTSSFLGENYLYKNF